MEVRHRVESQKQYWNEKSEEYNSRFGYDTLAGLIKIQRKTEILISEGKITEDSIVLELGCGTGAYTAGIASRARFVIAVDIAEDMVRRAPELKNVVYQIKDMHRLTFGTECFDAIIGAYVLQYADVNVLVSELLPMLREQGKMVFIEPNALNPIAFALTKIKPVQKMYDKPEVNNSFAGWRIKKQLELLGLRNVRTRAIEFAGTRYMSSRKMNGVLERIPVIKEIAGSLVISGER